MKNKINLILLVLLILTSAVIVYQNFIDKSANIIDEADGKQLYTCGMHPDIISDEPGDCPICGMRLTPVKNNKNTTEEKKILYWRAPMDPNEVYDHPGKSKMGMDLVPVYSSDASSEGVVTIDGALAQNMNLKTAVIKRMNLEQKITTNGSLEIDERNEYRINSKISGWIEKMYVKFEGERIKKGEKLFEIYSPELVSAQQELLTAVEYANSINDNINENRIVKNSIRKLQLLDLPDKEIQKIISTGKVSKTVTYYSPASGTVINRNAVEGQKISAGMTVLQIADLSSLWLIADIYENELSIVKTGNKAEIYFTFLPGESYQGVISFIYPTIEEKTRTVKIRIDIPNKNRKLKPGMFATVDINGGKLNNVIAIDESAVIRSGKSNIAVLSLGNGKFKPVNLKLGKYADGFYEVLSGLNEGDIIVESSQFLIDSESSLKAALKQFDSSNMDEKMKGPESEPESKHSHNKTDEKIIHLSKLDKNGDGKLFECPMDWQFLSDSSGRCDICEMFLKEYSIDEVKKNLTEHGIEFKK